MDCKFEERKQILQECREIAKVIMEELKDENIRKQLNTICKLESFPDLSLDDEMKEMKDFREVKGILKQVYIEVARTLMKILDISTADMITEQTSFNNTEPYDQMLAAEYIKMLPNAFISGPMKSAIKSPFKQVVKIVVEYYDSLPSDLKYSDIFPIGFKDIVRKRKSELKI